MHLVINLHFKNKQRTLLLQNIAFSVLELHKKIAKC